ncbi:MAG: inositol monophosphatase family protein [Acetobacteraceae bacterium]|nr:inositol monophosphatase family protein [Acetobacteraceae bacterium]
MKGNTDALDDLLAAAEAASDAAGEVIRPLFRARLAVEAKGDFSPVTVADRQAEQAIRAVLERASPGTAILGEEFGQDQPARGLCWVIDPIDGTRAFITGRPTFGTLLALLDGDQPILGIIDQPVTGERWIGAAGRRTIFRGPFGGAVGCRRCPSLQTAELSCTSPEMLGEYRRAWNELAGSVRRVSWGGDCYAYGLLALGSIDLIAEADLKLWDWAALVPVVEGAGGRVTDWRGARLRREGDGRVLAVGDPALLGPAVRKLQNCMQK